MQAFDPSGRYGATAVLDALQGRYGGRVVDYRYERLDRFNQGLGDLAGVVSGSVQHDTTADIKRTAAFTIRDGVDVFNYLADRIRPWFRLQMPDAGWVEWPLGVFLPTSPTRSLAPDRSVIRTVQAYDQTVVLSADVVTDRYSINVGTLHTDAIRALVAGSVPTVSVTPSALTLPVTWDYEAGTSKLTILNDLLSAMNYRAAWFDELGALRCEPYALPTSRDSSYTYATDAQSVLVGNIDQTLDLFDVPNVWTLVVSDTDQPPLTATVTNLAAGSPTSIPNRGRTIVSFQTGQSAADLTTLQALAAKTAYEQSQVYETATFGTAVMPFHQEGDVLALTVDDLGLSAVKVEELSWSMDLAVGAVMSHSVRRVVSVA